MTKEEAPYKTTRKIFDEIGQINPAFLNQSYRDFESRDTVHWSYPQQADLGMPRPDLSAIPVSRPDTPMWMPALNTGSRVERAARLSRGDTAPSVPGQDDPRKIAALLGLAEPFARHSVNAESSSAPQKEGYVPLRVMVTSGAQPAGPTPAQRHQRLGVAPHVHVALPGAVVAEMPKLEDAAKDEAVVSQTAAAPPTKENTPPKSGGTQPEIEETNKEESLEPDKSDSVHGESNVAVVNNITEDKAAGDEVSEGAEPEVRPVAAAGSADVDVDDDDANDGHPEPEKATGGSQPGSQDPPSAVEEPEDKDKNPQSDQKTGAVEPRVEKPSKTSNRSKKKPKKNQGKSGREKKS